MARRNLGKTQVALKVLIDGKEGTRKSNLAIQIARLNTVKGRPMRVLLLDLEYKAVEGFNEAYLESHGVDFGNVCEIRTRSLDTVKILVDKFVGGNPIPMLDENDNVVVGKSELDSEGNPFIADAIIFDSISVMNDLLVEGRQEIVKKRTNIKIVSDGLIGDAREMALENAGMQFLDYAKLKSKALKIVRDLNAVTGKHVIYVSRAKDARESKLVNGKMEQIDLGYEIMDATSFKFLPYEVSLHIHTQLINGVSTFAIKKDSTGVNIQESVVSDFSILQYDGYINNKNRTELLKTTSYDENLKKASAFTEDSEEIDSDVKMKLYTAIMMKAKTDQTAGAIIKDYCSKNNINGFKTPELVSLSDLTEIKKLLRI
ncbi:MAG: hypothetical protein ACRCZ0_11890 [Cetobacterium sp.]